MEYGVIIFFTTSAVMKAEKLLQNEGMRIKLIPTPREFSSDCGISLQFQWNDLEKIKTSLAKAKLEYDSINPLKKVTY